MRRYRWIKPSYVQKGSSSCLAICQHCPAAAGCPLRRFRRVRRVPAVSWSGLLWRRRGRAPSSPPRPATGRLSTPTPRRADLTDQTIKYSKLPLEAFLSSLFLAVRVPRFGKKNRLICIEMNTTVLLLLHYLAVNGS